MASRTRQLGWRAAAAAVGMIAAAATATPELPPPGNPAWEPLQFSNSERRTRYTPVENEQGRWLSAESDCAASALFLPLGGVDLSHTPLLRWRWRVDKALEIEDERSKPGDDFAARVYVLFPFEEEHSTFFSRLQRTVARILYEREPPGSALIFVWSSREPLGARWTNPYAKDSRMRVLGTGPGGQWQQASVDVPAEYLAAFGREPRNPIGLALMTDSDQSCQLAAARFADFRFASR
ncbi:MAG: DUF3047 domain-containing protein [Myxococcota bacterium]